MIPYPAFIVRRTVGRRRYALAQGSLSWFEPEVSPDDVAEIQLSAFNTVWEAAVQHPFYAKWASDHDLPKSISNIGELDQWPTLTKDILRAHEGLLSATPGIVQYTHTSGSTSSTFAFPRGAGELEVVYSQMWNHRRRFGLLPFDRFVFVSTTRYDAGVSKFRHVRTKLIRSVKDIISNSWRVNGFIPRPEDADAAVRAVRLMRPKYIAGFPSGISMLARRAVDKGIRFPSVRQVILTSETVEPQDLEVIHAAFGVHPIIEYGATEIGVLAGSDVADSWPIHTLWRANLLRRNADGEVCATTLTNRIFPLINYSLGDVVEPQLVGPGGTILSISDIRGRTRDTLRLSQKFGPAKEVMARDLTYLVREAPGVTSMQVSVIEEGTADILVVAPDADVSDLVARTSRAIRSAHPSLSEDSVYLRVLAHHIAGARGKRGVMVPARDVPLDLPRYKL